MGFMGRWRARRNLRRAERTAEEAIQTQQKSAAALDDALRLSEKALLLESELPQIAWYRPLKKYLTETGAIKAREKSALQWQNARCLMEQADGLRGHVNYLIAEAEARDPESLSTVHSNWALRPEHFHCAGEIGGKLETIPSSAGAYAFYFQRNSLPIPAEAYLEVREFQLLYLGIAGYSRRKETKGSLRNCLGDHLTAVAWLSDLRFHLGIILQEKLGLKLEQGRDGHPYQWSDEKALSQWLAEHAAVAWIESDRPWLVEHRALQSYGHLLPLNTEPNEFKEFTLWLKTRRRELLSSR